jgi:DNA modification methylase/superfamily II DNA or RNA helicase
MNYKEFLETKKKTFIESGFEINEVDLNENLFDFQKYAVRIALKKGKFALFFDCGLGKTLMQLSWSNAVFNQTKKKVLILAPLAVVEQTKEEAIKFNISLDSFDITNYDQLKNIENINQYSGVVLDESSILKGRDGKLSSLIIETFKNTPYKLACTATPSPNDHMELGQHVEFLGVDTYENMKSMFFVQDVKLKTSNKWRLKEHATSDFWKYVCTWSMSCSNPIDLGYKIEGYKLPEIEFIEHKIYVENNSLNLFGDVAVSATDLHKDLKRSIDLRIEKTKELINESKDQWIIWTLNNEEANILNKEIRNSINVQGSDSPEYKAKHLNGFAKNEFQNLITKTSIASFGMNYQNCSNMIFTSYDFKFEAFYQAVRRCYRFGQKNNVKVHILVPESQENVRQTIIEKQIKHIQKAKEMAKYSSLADYKSEVKNITEPKKVKTKDYELYLGDTFEIAKTLESESVDYTMFSPPFKDLYTYSDDPRDLSNVGGDKEFYEHFSYLVPELLRVTKAGRLLSMHVMQGTTSIGKDGFYSIVDFRGELIRLFQSFGWIFHAEKMIRKSPQLAAVRTKNHQLLHKSTKRDSAISRPGLADYILTFRKAGVNKVPITNDINFNDWCDIAEPCEFDKDINIELLRQISEPLWTDIVEGDTISGFRNGKAEKDEKHMTPTQLTVIRNCIMLWSNKNEVVFDPFGGVGSIGWQALKMDRKSISIELKESYFKLNEKNHRDMANEKNSVLSLFSN